MNTLIKQHSSLRWALGSALALSFAACATPSTVSPVRFKNQAPVTQVNDRQNVPEKPKENPFFKELYHFDGHYHGRLTRWMEFRGTGRTKNQNSLGEVPNSTWFTNRIGVRDMTPAEVARGPNQGEGPEAAKPWTILSSKIGGKSVGFIIKDANGERYLLKFDFKGFAEIETGVDVILARLLYACGYNVPEDYVVYFKRSDLKFAPDAAVKDVFGNKKPLTKEFFEEQLALVNIGEDGTIRGLTSKFISGKPLGGRTRDWPRKDDPNDTINHHERRDVRGQYAFFTWLDHADIKEDNTLDVYVKDPANENHKYVKHYLLDFGNALGTQAIVNSFKYIGFAYQIDFGQIGSSLFSLGIYRRPWEYRTAPNLRGVGLIDSQSLDPGHWSPYTPSYYAFLDSDKFDNYWASKILIRFTKAHIDAVVKEARYTDPQAEKYMAQVIYERQRRTARYWFEQVSPIDEIDVSSPDGETYELCFSDLLLKYDLDFAVGRTSYEVSGYDFDGIHTGYSAKAKGHPTGRACVDGLVPAAGKDGYTILRITTDRKDPNSKLQPTQVHLATDPATNALRVIGIHRD